MNYLKLQILLLLKRKSFIITLSSMMIFSMLVFILNCIEFFNNDIVSVKSAKYLFLGSDFSFASIILTILLPIISVLPFSDTFYMEHQKGTDIYCITKSSLNIYYFSKLLVAFFSGFIVVFTPLFVNYLLNLIAFPIDSSIDATGFSFYCSYLYADVMETGLFQNLFANNMYLYNFVYLILLSFFSGQISTIVFQFSYYYNKSRVILICSFFAIYNVMLPLLKSFGLDEFCIDNYIFAAKFYSGQTLRGLIITFAIMILLIIFSIPITRYKATKSYE